MSQRVELEELAARLADHGPVAYLVTVGEAGPHIVSVAVRLDGGGLVALAGRTTAGNIARRPDVSLVWPAPAGGAYSLIVDGPARLDTHGEASSVTVEPVRAVLHRNAGTTADGPSCITVVDRRA